MNKNKIKTVGTALALGLITLVGCQENPKKKDNVQHENKNLEKKKNTFKHKVTKVIDSFEINAFPSIQNKEEFSEALNEILAAVQAQIENTVRVDKKPTSHTDAELQSKRGILKFTFSSNNSIDIESWKDTTPLVTVGNKVFIIGLNVPFANTEEGWTEASRIANLINLIQTEVTAKKTVLEKEKVSFTNAQFEENEAGDLLLRTPCPRSKVIKFEDEYTHFLKNETWKSFPTLTENRKIFLDYLSQTI